MGFGPNFYDNRRRERMWRCKFISQIFFIFIISICFSKMYKVNTVIILNFTWIWDNLGLCIRFVNYRFIEKSPSLSTKNWCFSLYNFFCMNPVWIIRNHTNHIWPNMITMKIFFQDILNNWLFFSISMVEHNEWSLLRVGFNFCMILLWLPRNHTTHIWPSTITRNHIWPSMKSKKDVWSITRVVKNSNANLYMISQEIWT